MILPLVRAESSYNLLTTPPMVDEEETRAVWRSSWL